MRLLVFLFTGIFFISDTLPARGWLGRCGWSCWWGLCRGQCCSGGGTVGPCLYCVVVVLVYYAGDAAGASQSAGIKQENPQERDKNLVGRQTRKLPHKSLSRVPTLQAGKSSDPCGLPYCSLYLTGFHIWWASPVFVFLEIRQPDSLAHSLSEIGSQAVLSI